MRPSKPNGSVCEIVKSFKTCALNLPVDGSQDHFIHCFKEEQPCETGARQLRFRFSVLQECVRPYPFKFIADSGFEDADDKISLLNYVENFFVLIASSNVEGTVNEPSIFYY